MISTKVAIAFPYDADSCIPFHYVTGALIYLEERNLEPLKNFPSSTPSIRQNMERLKRFPLPVRMPKFVELELPDHRRSTSSLPFGLIDDIWDGYLIDAFVKISVSFGGSVHKKQPKHKGVYRILNMDAYDDSFNNPRIDVDKPRVLVSSVRSGAGRQGVVKGDVITHINGEEFHGTKADFKEAIRSAAARNDGNTLELILNAERSVVEAIKRRAAIMD